MKGKELLRINYISNLDLGEVSGGWSGINVAVYKNLAAQFDTRFCGPINPGVDYPAKVVSKLQRLQGVQGAFHFFSTRRLNRIAKLVAQEVDSAADCDFFHGPTPWVHYHSPRPYFLYLDTCFATYVDVYHDKQQFRPDDLARIAACEARWLAQAKQVFFGTQWALEQTVAAYGIAPTNLCVVGAGGSMTPPEQDAYAGDLNFLFVALDFEKKGGRICAGAVQKVREQFPTAHLTIIGAPPPPDILMLPGISYAGLLRKSVPAELQLLASLYATAFALVHPTSSDIQPLVISEAGYYGCPAIAAKSFGIPELIQEGVTGFLIETPLTVETFARRMLDLAADCPRYQAMRKAVRRHTTMTMTWEAVGTRILGHMNSFLSGH